MMQVIKTGYTKRILHGYDQTDSLDRLRGILTLNIRAHIRWAWSKVCRLIW